MHSILAVLALISGSNTWAAGDSTDTVCGKDNRTPSQVKPIARLMMSESGDAGCTGTLISNSCMISAGHCIDYLKVAEFQVPTSNSNGTIQHPGALDQYSVESVIGYRYDGTTGRDWSVMKLKANPLTAKKAGEVQGFYSIQSKKAWAKGTVVRITGYGASEVSTANYAQQTSTGKITKNDGPAIYYQVDTMGGNSGSAIIVESTKEIMGIHTNGGCTSGTVVGANQGTIIAENNDFQQAIDQCLSMDQ